ncbi:MAG: hypothetical protein HY821_12605 [Acidobacteria bacterium]|nr:hypothetical protein [Acidobacteriota bacterium]
MTRATGLLLLLAIVPAHAASKHHRSSVHRQSSGVSLRKKLHVNDLITEPGTVELDFGGLYSYTTSTFTLPSALKWTPDGDSLFWGRTEYSASFDSVASGVSAGGRNTQFSDRLTFAATSILFDSEHFDIAVAPTITAMLRNDSGVRLGATAVGRLDKSGNSLGVALSWSAATVPSDTNPAGVWDLDIGYGRQLGRKLRRFTPHADAVLEHATGFERTLAVFGGVAYEITGRASIDAVWQRYGLVGGEPDRQFLVSFTYNFGKRP